MAMQHINTHNNINNANNFNYDYEQISRPFLPTYSVNASLHFESNHQLFEFFQYFTNVYSSSKPSFLYTTNTRTIDTTTTTTTSSTSTSEWFHVLPVVNASVFFNDLSVQTLEQHVQEYWHYQRQHNIQQQHQSQVVSLSSWSYDPSAAPSKDEYMYFSGNLVHDNFAPLRSQIPFDTFVNNKGSNSKRSIRALVWAGHKDVHATLHYDVVYNVYVHLYGVKQFRLIPPRSLLIPETTATVDEDTTTKQQDTLLKMYGRFHPHACQSRLHTTTTITRYPSSYRAIKNCSCSSSPSSSQPSSSLPSLSSLEVLEFTLLPGDVLFIPPFWLHETVVADDAAISVSLWWDAHELDLMDEVYGVPLPLESMWTDSVNRAAINIFISSLLHSLEKNVNQHTSKLEMEGNEKSCKAALCRFDKRDTLRVLRNRYDEDWRDIQTCNNNNNNSSSNSSNETCLLTKEAKEQHDEFSVEWMEKVQLRSDRMATLFSKFLFSYGDINNSNNSNNNIDLCADRIAVMQVKLCDYVEDVFNMLFPQTSTAESIFRFIWTFDELNN